LLQRHLAKVHKSGSGSEQAYSENDEESDEFGSDDNDGAKGESHFDFSIDAITGNAYASRAKDRLKNFKAVQCPYADFDTISSESVPDTAESSSRPGGSKVSACQFVFSRAYDLRRHLLAEHHIDASKESVDAWVAKAKAAAGAGR